MSITARRPSESQPDQKEHPAAQPGRKNALTQPIRLGRPTARAENVRLGGDPRVDLLPPEVRSSRRNRRTRRGFGWGVLLVAVAVFLAVAGAFALNIVSQGSLIAARAQSASLLAQQQTYSAVRDVQKQVSLARAAQRVGASTEIDWKTFLDKMGAAQPAGLTLTTLSLDSASPIAVYQQSADPLQGPRVGTLTVVASSPELPDVPAWVTALQAVPGVVDVVPGTVNRDDTSHVYTATVTIHVDDSLYTKRFEPKEK